MNELDEAFFAHDAAYSDSKDFAKRTISGKTFKDRAYEITINPIYNGYQRGLASIVYKMFDKKARYGAKASVNEELAKKFHKPVIKIFKRQKVYATFKDNIWAANLAEMGSFSSKN